MKNQARENRITEHFPEMLDRSLETVLSGRGTVDSCCRRHPDAAAELRPLLEIAALARKALAVEATAEARAATRKTLLAHTARPAGEKRGKWDRQRFSKLWGWAGGRRLLRPALVAVAIVIASAGTALAATRAEPDSFLYPLKQRLEGARTSLAAQKLDRATVETGYANRRLDEIIDMVNRDKAGYVPELLSRCDTHLSSAEALVREARAEGEDAERVERVEEMIAAARERRGRVLNDIRDRLPEEVRDAIGLEADNDNDSSAAMPPSAPVAPAAPAPQPPGSDYNDDDYYEHRGGYGGDDDSGGGGSQPGSNESPHREEPGEAGDGNDDGPGDDDHLNMNSMPPGGEPGADDD